MKIREILFKAKRLDNGEWEEGSLVVKRDPLVDTEYVFILSQESFQSFVTGRKVDPATVCQWTGLTDKNGVKIFEWDVVKVPGFTDGLCKIVFRDFAFYIVRLDGLVSMELVDAKYYEIEAVGNIHEEVI